MGLIFRMTCGGIGGNRGRSWERRRGCDEQGESREKGMKESGNSASPLRFATVASVRTMDRIPESTEKGLRFWGSRSEVSKIILNRVLCLILIASKLSQVAKDMGC